MEFVHDMFGDGKNLRLFNVVDGFNVREWSIHLDPAEAILAGDCS
jgi:hypothetical protein